MLRTVSAKIWNGSRRFGRLFLATTFLALGLSNLRAATVTWDASTSSGVTGYRIYYNLGDSTPVVVDVGNTNSYRTPDLLNGATYGFYVTAYNRFGMESAPCLAVQYSEPSSIKISWPSATITNLAGYKLFYAPSGGAYAKVLMGTQTNWTLANIAGGQTYTFYLGVYDTSGVEVERYLTVTRTVSTNGATAPVQLLPTQLPVNWTKSTHPSAASYKLFYSIAGAPYLNVPISARTNWTLTDVVAGKSCAVFLVVYDQYGVEKERYDTVSTTVSATGPTAPLFLQGPINLAQIFPIQTNSAPNLGIVTNSTISAAFVSVDRTSLGTWKGRYGADGYIVLGDGSLYPSNLVVSATGKSYILWEASSANSSALQKSLKVGDRISSAWYSTNNFVLKLPFTDTKIHRLALYCLDYENKGLKQYVELFNMDTGALLQSYALSNFTKGAYVRFDIRGKVSVRFRSDVGDRAVLSGVFFDTFENKSLTPNVVLNWETSPAPNLAGYNVYTAQNGGPTNKSALAVTNTFTLTNLVAGNTYSVWIAARNVNGLETEVFAPITVTAAANATAPTLSLSRFAGSTAASFVGVDRSTLGDWKNSYGSDGYIVLGDGSLYPPNLVVSATGKSWVLWENPSTNTAALRKTLRPQERIAGAWYAAQSFTVKLAFDDSTIHRVALYCLDFEKASLLQYLEVYDLATGATLSTAQVGQFSKGAYVLFDVKGKVGIRARAGDGNKAVVSGLFFDKPPAGNS